MMLAGGFIFIAKFAAGHKEGVDIMLNLLLNNETTKNLSSLPFLITTKPNKEVFAMTKQSIPETKPICQVEGCNRPVRAKGYCARHYTQIRRHKKISGNPTKLKYGEPNRYVFEGSICKIELYDNDGNVRDYAIIDTEDYEKVNDIKWAMDGHGYATHSRRNGVSIRLHRIVLGLTSNDMNPDHIFGNLLDNRKSQLRVCTHQQNISNSKRPKNNTSGYKGVTWDKSKNKWQAQIKYNYETIHLGRFNGITAAAEAYNAASTKFFGEFARLNHIQTHPNTARR